MPDTPDPGRLDIVAVLQELAEYRAFIQSLRCPCCDGNGCQSCGGSGKNPDAEALLAKYAKKP